LQHHDAVTGTSKEKTNKDYENMAIIGVEKIKKHIYMLFNILGGDNPFDSSIGYEEEITIEDKNEGENNNFIIIDQGFHEDYLFNYRLNVDQNNNLKESFEYEIISEKNSYFGNNISFYDADVGLKYSSLQFNLPLNKNNLVKSISIMKSNKMLFYIKMFHLKIQKFIFIINTYVLYKGIFYLKYFYQ
jgi:hypothetical protein